MSYSINPLSTKLLRELNGRRADLGMTYAVLAKRSGLGMRTVQRILSGNESAANLRSVLAIADALGASLEFKTDDINRMRQEQAERKAAKLVGLLQGTSALEAQGLDADEQERARQRTVRDLLASRRGAIWDE